MYIHDGGLRSTLTLQISNLPSALRRSHRNSLDPQTPLALALPDPASASRRRRDDPRQRRCRCGTAPPARMRHGLQLRLHSARALSGTHQYCWTLSASCQPYVPLPFDSSLPSLDPRVPVRSRQCCVACLLVSAINSTLGYAMVAFNGKIVDSEFRLG